MFIVATDNITLKATSSEGLAWVTDIESGSPQANVPVMFYDKDFNQVGTTTSTNQNGLVYLKGINSPVYARVEGTNHLAFVSTDWGSGVWTGDLGIAENYYAAFYATGLGSLLWVVLWGLTYRESRGPAAQLPSPVPWLELLGNRTVLGLVCCKFFQDYLFLLFVTWLPAYLIKERSFTIMNMGWYSSLPWIAGFRPTHRRRRLRLAHPAGISVTVSRKSFIITLQLMAASRRGGGLCGKPNDGGVAVHVLGGVRVRVHIHPVATSPYVAPPFAAGSLAGIMNTAGALAAYGADRDGLLFQITGSFQDALLIGSCMVLLAACAMAFIVGELKPLDIQPKTAPASRGGGTGGLHEGDPFGVQALAFLQVKHAKAWTPSADDITRAPLLLRQAVASALFGRRYAAGNEHAVLGVRLDELIQLLESSPAVAHRGASRRGLLQRDVAPGVINSKARGGSRRRPSPDQPRSRERRQFLAPRA